MEKEIYRILYRLGITAKYRGFFYVANAVDLALKQPDRMLMVTKWLYPEVAKQYDTNWICVERNIRTAVNVAWQNHRTELEELAHTPLNKKPTPSQFIAILMAYITREKAA